MAIYTVLRDPNGNPIKVEAATRDGNGKNIANNYATKTYVDNQLNLCVKLTDIDADLSLTSTNPIQNKVISKQIKDINYTIMTMKEELFETILSEVDYKVDYATIYPIPDTLSDDDGTHRVVYSDTQLKEIEGNSVAFNQLAETNIDEGTRNGITITKDENGNLILNGTCSSPNNYYMVMVNRAGFAKVKLIAGHKYLKTTRQNQLGSYFTGMENTSTNLFDTFDVIFTFGSIQENNLSYVLVIQPNAICNSLKVIPQLFDLTQMFGAGNEPTTVEEFNRIFPNNYYQYNAGEIKNTVIKGVKVNGYNALSLDRTQGTLNGNDYTKDNKQDFEENKYYAGLAVNDYVHQATVTNVSISGDTISFTSSSAAYGLALPIKVIAGRAYTLEKTGTNAGTCYVAWYDQNGLFISSNVADNNISNTAPNNAYWGVIVLRANADGATATYSNIAFHVTGTRTGYAPYKEPHIIQIPQTELKSAGSVHDTIKFVEGNVVAGQQRYNMVHVSRVGSVDLGTLRWVYVGTSYNAYAQLPNAKKVSPSVLSNMLCSNYKVYKEDDITAQTKGISFANILIIKDSSLDGKTAEEIKTAMSGVMLNYEKAEPTETTLATDLTFEEVSAIIEQGGSIETVFEIVPPSLKTAFVVNKAIVS